MSQLHTPLTDSGLGQDIVQPNTIGAAMPQAVLPQIINYVGDVNVVARVKDEILQVVEYTRTNRVTLEDEWRAIRRMTMMEHDDGQRYKGRSNAYLPIYPNILRTLVSNLSRGLFPSDDYMDVTSRNPTPGMPDNSKAVKAYLQWEFERVAKLRTNIKPFLRQFSNYGNSVMKYWYRKESRYEGRVKSKTPTLANIAAMMSKQHEFKSISSYEGLAVSPRSIFYTYVFPWTAAKLEEATMVFEDIDVPRQDIERRLRSGEWQNREAALNGPNPAEHNVNQGDQFRSVGMETPQESALAGTVAGDVRTITEVWTYMVLPSSAYVEGEDTECPIPVKIVLAGSEPLQIIRNPYWHQRPPYEFSRMNVEPGLFYGNGFGRLARHLQYLSNDFANQTNDAGIYALNPVMKVNPGVLAGPLKPIRPGVVWQMTDPNGVVFDRPPVELIQAGLMMLGNYVGMTQDYSGAPPMMQGMGGGKGAKTATGAQILQRNAMQPLQDTVEDIELDLMVPLLHGTWINAQQFRESSVMARVAGAELKVDPADLAGDFDFVWMASSQAVNQQVRAQQALQLIQGVSPLIPYLSQLGYVFDPVPLIQRIYGDGMGFRGFDQVIKRMPQAQGLPPGAPVSADVAGQAGAQSGDRMRSALEQIAGAGGAEAVPGEAEEFMAVRGEADAIAGQMGGAPGFEGGDY